MTIIQLLKSYLVGPEGLEPSISLFAETINVNKSALFKQVSADVVRILPIKVQPRNVLLKLLYHTSKDLSRENSDQIYCLSDTLKILRNPGNFPLSDSIPEWFL